MPPSTPQAPALKVRPSKMGLTTECRGHVKAEVNYPYESSLPADRGKALHDAKALVFQAYDKIRQKPGMTEQRMTVEMQPVWDQINQTLSNKPAELKITQEDIASLPEVYALGRQQEPAGKVIIWVEKSLDLSFMGMDGGKPDLVYVSLEHKAAVIIDWKFGSRPVDDPEDNDQMQDYGAGVINAVQKEFNVTLESVEGVIIQPFGMKKDDWARSHTWTTAELRDIAKAHKAIAQEAKAPDAPRVAGPHCESGWCRARKEGVSKDGVVLPVCGDYQAWKEGKQAVKEEAHQQELKTVTEGTPVTVAPMVPLITPVIVIAAEVMARMTEKKDQIMALQVVDESTASRMGALSKEIRADTRLIDENRKNLGKPFYDFFKEINAAAAPAIKAGEDAATYADAQVTALKQRQAAEVQRLKDEEARRLREAEAARRAEEEAARAKQREVEEAARKAQEQAAKADELKGAAKKKAEAEAARLQAEAEAQRKAQAELEEKQAQARARADMEAQEAERKRIAAEEELAKKVAGQRTTVEVTSTISDITKVPQAWMTAVLMINQKSLDLLVKQGTLNEKNAAGWLDIKRETVSVRSR